MTKIGINQDKKILDDLKKHPLSTPYEIRCRGIVKNYPSLMKKLRKLVKEDRVVHISYCNRYYILPLPQNLTVLGIIGKQIDQTIQVLATNQNLKNTKCYRDFQAVYEMIWHSKGRRTAKVKKILKLFPYTNGLSEDLGPKNDHCLRKWFLIILYKAIIWELEIIKLNESPFANNPDDDALMRTIWFPMLEFENFLKNYDPSNSESILGISYRDLARKLDLTNWLDQKYYKELKSNKIPLKVEIDLYQEHLLKDSNKDASRTYLGYKKKSKNYSEHLQKKLNKHKELELEQKFAAIEQKLTLKMKNEKEKNKDKEDEIQKKYQQRTSQAKNEIRKKADEKYAKKYERELSDTYPKTAKQITRIIKTIEDKSEKPDIWKMLLRKKIESDRILFGQVNDSDIEKLARLYSIRKGIQLLPKDSQYTKLQKIVKRKMPELVIS